MSIDNIHPDFKLNGISFFKETLKEVAHSFIKEGEPFEKSIGHFLSDWLDGSSTVNVQTSGSTGVPKQIVLQKQQMVNSAVATGHFFDLRPGNSALLCLSADYIAGKMMLVRAMVLGLDLNCIAPTSNPLKGNKKTYDFGAMVPMQLRNSVNRIHRIKTLIVGGAPVSFNLKQQLRNAPSHIFETYGMTETITHIAVKRINTAMPSARANDEVGQTGKDVQLSRAQDVRLSGVEAHFKTLPNITLSVDDRSCLIIDAPKVSNERIITNDVVNLISENDFQWLGRYDNVINSGGIKLHPERIEEKLASLITQRFFVAGVSDEKLGQKLVLLIEGKVDVNQISRKIKTIKTLDNFEIPKEVCCVPEFIYNGFGKIRREATTAFIFGKES